MAETLISMFFYGSLKRGQSNHDRFCRAALRVEPATTLGRLYELPFGFPGLRIYGRDVRAVGTTDYLADAEKQLEVASAPLGSEPAWDTVYGELFTFTDPERRLIVFDALEGYVPGENRLFRRVLIPVQSRGEPLLAWAYELRQQAGAYLPGGRWPA
ncbi:MAG TPA: gamma-glutamylcyclotransferase family protein [Rubrobacteraceae bacterium]|nr:gamma-glutamylcyclotransferase family protein [Rubrobacteraceae bacterium]